MQIIDIIIAIVLVLGFINGLRAGLVNQVIGLAGLIGGLLVGRMFYMTVGGWLVDTFGLSPQVAHVVAFILILILVPLLFNMVGWLVSRILNAICLGWIDSLLGGAVGALKCALFVGIVITGIEFFDKSDIVVSESHKDASVMYHPIHKATGIFFGHIKQELKTLGL